MNYIWLIIMVKQGTIPSMSEEEEFLYGLRMDELRTICNRRKGVSCLNDNGGFLPREELVALIMMTPDFVPKLPPRNKAPYHPYEFDDELVSYA
jgi:hypothetical protein